MKRTDCIAAALSLALAGPATATDVNVVDLFGNKAVVSIDGDAPRTMSVKQRSPKGIALVAVDRETATFEIDGKRRALEMRQAYASPATARDGSITLKTNERGHFLTDDQVNGGTVRFPIDTGATMIALPAAEARRIGVNYLGGERRTVQTADEPTAAYRVK